MVGEITGLIAGAAANAARARKALADAKKGKSKEQKDIIDFLLLNMAAQVVDVLEKVLSQCRWTNIKEKSERVAIL